jgi:hypothetical protein
MLAVLGAGCGDDDRDQEARASSAESDTRSSLCSADEEREQNERDSAEDVALGQSVVLEGIRLTVAEARLVPDLDLTKPYPATHEVVIRVENPDVDDPPTFEWSMRCAGVDQDGAWFFGTTFDPNEPTPPGTFDEGTLLIGPPTDLDGMAVPCSAAVLRVAPFVAIIVDGEEPPSAEWPLPALPAS